MELSDVNPVNGHDFQTDTSPVDSLASTDLESTEKLAKKNSKSVRDKYSKKKNEWKDGHSVWLGVPVIKQNELSRERIIGEGQYGKVWEGRCRGEVVAVKVLNDQEWDDAIIKKFEKEVEIMSQLHHPNVVLLMGACTEARDKLAIVTELCEGNLRSIIHNKKITLRMLQKLNFAIDIAQGMAWLHNTKPHQIIHRDLKLTNLLVDANWRVKVCDFGLSDILKTDFLQDEGVAVGSALWMSPEVLEGRKLTEKIDVYSFGLILWEIVMRVQPFGEFATVAELRKAVCKDGIRPPLKKLNIPPCLCIIMEQCWQQDPQKRPTFVKVLEMLKDAMVEIFLSPVCHDTSKLWRMERRWRGKEQIKFESFARAVCKYLRIKYQEKALAFKCLQALLTVEKKKGADSTPMVPIDRLGLVMSWFGPMTALSWEKPKVTFLDRILCVVKHGWFFGDIDREESETLLRDFRKKPGTFLVRVNLGGTTEPMVSPFTISKVNNHNLEHIRVYHYKDRTGYFIQVKSKSGTKQVYSRGGIEKLISKLKSKGILRKNGGVPGQKYKSLFEGGENNDISIYLQIDNDEYPVEEGDGEDNSGSVSYDQEDT